jgi:hypothetical protein
VQIILKRCAGGMGFLSDDSATGVEEDDRSFEWNCEKAVARGEYIKI